MAMFVFLVFSIFHATYICTSLQLGDVNELMKLLTSSFEVCAQIIVISKAIFRREDEARFHPQLFLDNRG
jgi:hypothetical protein